MKHPAHLLRTLSLAITFSLSFSTSAAINSAAIITSSLSPTCLEYQVVGICYWLLCTNFGCKVRTSAKVRHYVPDAVVSAYSSTGMNPWVEMSPLGSRRRNIQPVRQCLGLRVQRGNLAVCALLPQYAGPHCLAIRNARIRLPRSAHPRDARSR